MFEEMRLKAQQLSDEETIALLDAGEYGVLSTIGANGYPYGVPINYIYDDGKIYIHSAVKGHKLRNFEYDSRVSFCVVAEAELLQEDVNTMFKSVIAFGKIRELTEMKDFIPSGLEYVEENKDAARVYEIEIEHITGKRGE